MKLRQSICPPLLALASLAACGDGGTPPASGGELRATLQSPAGVEGAAVLELEGPGIGEVEGETGRLFSERSGAITRVVVVLDTPGEIRFRVRTAEGSPLPQARVIEVADGANQLRTSMTGYRLVLAR